MTRLLKSLVAKCTLKHFGFNRVAICKTVISCHMIEVVCFGFEVLLAFFAAEFRVFEVIFEVDHQSSRSGNAFTTVASNAGHAVMLCTRVN